MPPPQRPLPPILALLPTLGFLLVVLAPPVNHDVAALLAFTGRWLAGEGLYTDLIDVNPPLIFLLNLVPAAIGAATPLGAVPALLLCVLALGALAVVLALRAAPAAGPVEAACLLAALPLATVAAGYEFAQREHLMAVAALPYLLAAARRAEGGPGLPRGLILGTAVLAALGFALKPHFLAVPALVEALVLARRGPRQALRDPVPWTMAAVWLLYLAAIPLAFPAYLERVLPLVRADYLALQDLPWWRVGLGERLGSALLLLLPLAVLAFRPGGARRFGTLPRVLALAALGGAAAAAVQGKGWDYHALPARLFTGLMAVAMAARWLDGALPEARARRAAPGVAAAAALGLALVQATGAAGPWRQLRWPGSDGAMLTAALGRVAPGGRVLVLSPYIDPVFQALAYTGGHFVLPTMTIWPLQNAYGGDLGCDATLATRYRAPEAMPAGEALVWEGAIASLLRGPRPDALLVALNPRIHNCGRGFDLLAYLARDPRAAAALERYAPVAEVAGHRLLARRR